MTISFAWVEIPFSGAELMTGIEKRFGLVLSLSILLEAPTPRTLAEAIFKTNVSRVAPCLISINPNGAPPPIFCVHGNEGESTAPQRLSTVLGTRAFYAFRGIGLEQGEEFLTSVDAIAANYLAGVAQARPEGPHVLFGHCAGTMIAYEMAQQLAATGNRPVALILADPEVSKDFAPYLHNSGLALSLMQSSWRKRAAQLDQVLRSNPNPTGDARRKLVAGGIKHAIGTYMPKRYDGPTLLLYTPVRKAVRGPVDIKELIRFSRLKLAGYKVPSRIERGRS